MNQYWGVDADPTAQGRIKGASPVAVLDIGSNSVRLVVYERHARSLTPLYNEKVACALGRGMAANGRLADENVARALTAIKRFALVARLMRTGQVHVLATSAVRDASNRDAFVEAVEAIMDVRVNVLSGEEEAHYAALGVVAGYPDFIGMVGDLGGGSLELSSIADGSDTNGETYELGVIRLQDDSGGSPTRATEIVRSRLRSASLNANRRDGTFCAIGGTWRTLAKIHQNLRGYPLHMVQHYTVRADDMIKLCSEIVSAGGSNKSYPGSEHASSSRRELVPFGAAVLGEVLKAGRFDRVTFSALGVREGFLFSLLAPDEQRIDPLLQGAEEMSVLRSRSPAHTRDLIEFTDKFVAAARLEETNEQMRLRRVACLLADIGWRAHPDYRAEQSIDSVAYSALNGIDHPGRAFLSEVLAVRYVGIKRKGVAAPLLSLADSEASARAKLIGALFRVAYPMSAAMPGVLPRVGFRVEGATLWLDLPRDLAFLDGEHLRGRLEQFAGVAQFGSSAVKIA
ncbi:Ppx/GppA phosphatase family protein [Devosia nitrariae]|uniref:Exopolyphosphatase n=1 Tax=Devosia nitrariae TaxID=2071872 RepID=A0ABQ5WCK8_9HYPH|nr:Ppx/GppA phosphatase family protein [Devosia nitrariae]GLQ57687.1 exopolyphosphatase [Devosia nitrariae]